MAAWDPEANELFLRAREIVSPEERGRALEEACATNAELRARVDALLRASEQAGSFLETPVTGPFQGGDAARREGAGTVIGPYRLLQPIGEGGMGAVWMAEQTEPVRRLVALKVIKPDMGSAQIIARFEAERQALALMDHPNIARVLDAGTTGGGRPYFVMELVLGVPITKYCDDNRLTPRQRLELFVPVCQAVQHAHQKGTIHRDLKPSNVLVARFDDAPVPKVIDFGIAKATGPQLTEHTQFTEFGQMVGTLEYMSPEQAGVNQLDVVTRSDVYSLGVLLYELLTGTTPLERRHLNGVSLLEVLRIIREEHTPRPSTRLATIDEPGSIAANRGLEARKLSGLVQGELDWIVMKALDKDRNRRYETASAFAQDVQRYLHDEPVQACPPGRGYRLKKFLWRNKGPVAAAAVFVVLLAGGIVATSWQALRASWAEQDSKGSEALARNEEKKAKASAEQAKTDRGIARQERDGANQLLYSATVRLADQARRANDLRRARELLDGLARREGLRDLRGWDWDYLQALCARQQLALGQGPEGGGAGELVGLVAWAPEGRRLACYAVEYTREGGQADFALREPLQPPVPRSRLGTIHFKGNQGTFIVWEPGAALPVRRFASGHQAWALDWAPDGTRFASAGRDGTVKVWDAVTGKELVTFGDLAPAYGLSWGPDGRRLAVESAPAGGTGRTCPSSKAS